MDGRTFDLTILIGALAEKLKNDAAGYFGRFMESCVLTVPSDLLPRHREIVDRGFLSAGLQVVDFLNEAVAVVYAHGLQIEPDTTALVFNLGSKSLEVSILHIRVGNVDVVTTTGDAGVGGDSWRESIFEWALQRASEESGIDFSTGGYAVHRLREEAEKAQEWLNVHPDTKISLPYLAQSPPFNLDLRLSREMFEQMTNVLVDRCRSPLELAMGIWRTSRHARKRTIEHVFLVGRSARMPMVRRLVEEVSGRSVNADVDPEEVLAIGAASFAAVKYQET